MLHRGMAHSAMLALLLVLAACDAEPTPTPTQAPTDTPQAEPTPADEPTLEPTSASAAPTDIAEHLRQKTAQMWDTYNSYDLEGLRAFYEESYWKEQEEEIRSNLKPFRSFGLTITVEETSPPTEISPGKWEIRHTGSFSMGSVDMVFIYEEFGGAWLLTYAEDQ